MSKLSTKFSDNSKKPIVISRKPLTWLDHAENHFSSGSVYIKSCNDYLITSSLEEHLMFLCLMSHVGMFDTQF